MSIERVLLSVGVSVEDAIVVLAGLSAFASIWAVWRSLLERAPMHRRMKELRQRQKDLAAGLARPRRHALRRATAMTTMRRITTRLKLVQSKTAGSVTEQLARCGWRSKDAITIFVFLRIAVPLAFLVVALVLVPLLVPEKVPAVTRWALPLLAAGLGIYVPRSS